jgi:hypothetical protein
MVTFTPLLMIFDVARLLLGLLMVLFHRQIADWIVDREHSIATFLQERGVPVPSALKPELAYNLYYLMGVFVCLLSIARIWSSLPN